MEKTKISLVYPRGGDIKQGIPLAFGYLKSNTDESKYDIKVIDCTLDNIAPDSSRFIDRIKQIKPEVVGVTSWSVNFPEALAVSKTAKTINPNVTTVLGGAHATVAAEKVIKNEEIDFVFRGEAEFSFSVFLGELKKANPDFSKVKGLVYKNGKGEIVFNEIARIENLDDIKLPDYNAINIEKYIKKGHNYQIYNHDIKRSAPIWVTRGCPYRCAFCSVPQVSGKKVRHHSLEYMMSWITFLYEEYNIRGFSIIDDNFTFYTDYAKNFCREVIKLSFNDVEFNCPNGVRMQRGDYELWCLMRQAGWRSIVVAPESGSERVLKSLRKDLNPKEVPNIVKDIKKAGLRVDGFFMIGCPGETREDIIKTESLIRKCIFDGLSITVFQPMPGTLIYDELVAKKQIADDILPELFGDCRKRSYIHSTLKDFDFVKFINDLRLIKYSDNPMVLLKKGIKLGRKLPREILCNPLLAFKILIEIMKSCTKRLTFFFRGLNLTSISYHKRIGHDDDR